MADQSWSLFGLNQDWLAVVDGLYRQAWLFVVHVGNGFSQQPSTKDDQYDDKPSNKCHDDAKCLWNIYMYTYKQALKKLIRMAAFQETPTVMKYNG